MPHVISMHRPGDPRQTAVSDLSKVILCLVAPRFEHNALIVRAKLHNHSAIAVLHTRDSMTLTAKIFKIFLQSPSHLKCFSIDNN